MRNWDKSIKPRMCWEPKHKGTAQETRQKVARAVKRRKTKTGQNVLCANFWWYDIFRLRSVPIECYFNGDAHMMHDTNTRTHAVKREQSSPALVYINLPLKHCLYYYCPHTTLWWRVSVYAIMLSLRALFVLFSSVFFSAVGPFFLVGTKSGYTQHTAADNRATPTFSIKISVIWMWNKQTSDRMVRLLGRISAHTQFGEKNEKWKVIKMELQRKRDIVVIRARSMRTIFYSFSVFCCCFFFRFLYWTKLTRANNANELPANVHFIWRVWK